MSAPIRAADVSRIMADHQPALSALQSRSRKSNGAVFTSVMWDRGYLQAVRDVIGFVLDTQTHTDDLTAAEVVAELRKGTGSIYRPAFSESQDAWVECPSDRIHNAGRLTLITAEGVCPDCGYEFAGGAA